MDFSTFLSSAQSQEFWQQHKSLCFTGQQYPCVWLRMLFDALKKRKLLQCNYQRLFLENTDKKTLYGILSQSILGSFSFFWLGNLSEEKESKALQDFSTFLTNYAGPHALAYFIDQSSKLLPKNTGALVVLPHEITLDHIITSAQLFDITLDAKKTAFLKSIFSSQTSITLDQVCMVVQHLELISTKYLNDYIPLLTSISGILPTLSHLSDYFFSKNNQKFFLAWEVIKPEYPDMFWITFWSEQLWKAYYVIHYLKQNDFVKAKRMSFRLPYTFVTRDWKKTNPALLINAYNFLYKLDYGIKTGSTFCGLDLFFINYFTGKF